MVVKDCQNNSYLYSMEQRKTQRIKTITEFHRLRGIPMPEHPLISVIDYSIILRPDNIGDVNWMFDFYQISLKRGMNGLLKYGQLEYDFDEGVMFFIAPNQVFRIEPDEKAKADKSGWMLLIHPDFFWKTSMATTINGYDFFNYSVNEALFLSEKEETTVNFIIASIRQEYHANIDKFSQNIILSHVETLLNYCERFYERQFITRKIANHQTLDSLEIILDNYFKSDALAERGLPTVQWVAQQLNISPNYLSRLLSALTGQSTQQFIHDKIIEKAKQMLSTTSLSIGEIAYGLGFEHPQSFSKLFKNKTSLSPIQFRASYL